MTENAREGLACIDFNALYDEMYVDNQGSAVFYLILFHNKTWTFVSAFVDMRDKIRAIAHLERVAQRDNFYAFCRDVNGRAWMARHETALDKVFREMVARNISIGSMNMGCKDVG